MTRNEHFHRVPISASLISCNIVYAIIYTCIARQQSFLHLFLSFTHAPYFARSRPRRDMAETPSFTCTFCHCLTLGRPEVLGRSARLACYPCSSALLDLSICWVCGEMIVRGEECVSFGWCFWHRACYGCLLCGNRTVRKPGPSLHGRARGRDACAEAHMGDEVYEPPLCISCETDTVSTGQSVRDIVDAGLAHEIGRAHV